MKKLIGFTVIAISVMLALAGSAQKPAAPAKPLGIVRLHMLEGGRFFCSGVVIAPHLIATAAHCVQGAPLNVPVILVKSKSDDVGTQAAVYDYQPRADQALLYGDFSQYEVIKMAKNPTYIMSRLLDKGHGFHTCGYPWGDVLTCTQVNSISFGIFGGGIIGVYGLGWMFPGDSGGPLIDNITGEVVGLNTGIDGERVFFATSVGFATNMGISEELY